MICPKCDQEYIGNTCPNCEGPKIIVNNQEYLQRKMEYEKKQAAGKSASSSDTDKNIQKADKGHLLTGDEVKPDEVFRRIVDMARTEGSNAGRAISKSAEKRRSTGMAVMKRVLIIMMVFAAVVLGSGIVTNIVKRSGQILYTRYNGKIYNVSGIDSEYVCDYDKAYFKTDGREFFVPDEPQEVSDANVITRLASDRGKYYISEVYDEHSGMYALYLWNKDVNYKLSENIYKKNIIYLSDDGNVIYKENEMINDVGGMGSTSLYLTQLTRVDTGVIPTTTQLSEYVRQSCVYADRQLIIYNTEDDELYSFYYGKNKTQKVIAQDVTAIYPMVNEKKNYYSYRASQVNTDKDTTAIIYVSDGNAWLYDCAEKNPVAVLVDAVSGTAGEYIITDSCGIYSINSSILKYASFKNDKAGEYKDVIKLGNTSNFVYFADKEVIAAVDGNGKLQLVKKGVLTYVTDNVSEGSLTIINNTDSGLTYIRNNVQYYYNMTTAKEFVMTETAEKASTSDTLMYRKKLYYYNGDGRMCSCTVKGRDNKLIGDVEKFWLGR